MDTGHVDSNGTNPPTKISDLMDEYDLKAIGETREDMEKLPVTVNLPVKEKLLGNLYAK